jgi:hypothetical protein
MLPMKAPAYLDGLAERMQVAQSITDWVHRVHFQLINGAHQARLLLRYGLDANDTVVASRPWFNDGCIHGVYRKTQRMTMALDVDDPRLAARNALPLSGSPFGNKVNRHVRFVWCGLARQRATGTTDKPAWVHQNCVQCGFVRDHLPRKRYCPGTRLIC